MIEPSSVEGSSCRHCKCVAANCSEAGCACTHQHLTYADAPNALEPLTTICGSMTLWNVSARAFNQDVLHAYTDAQEVLWAVPVAQQAQKPPVSCPCPTACPQGLGSRSACPSPVATPPPRCQRTSLAKLLHLPSWHGSALAGLPCQSSLEPAEPNLGSYS